MKKLLSIILILISLTVVASCNNTYSMENKVTMTLTDEWQETITYSGVLPQMSFEFEGSFNVYETSSSLGYVFTKNDNYLLSNALAKHFSEKVKDNYIIVKKTEQTNDSAGAVFGKTRLTLDEGTASYEYSLVTWDETGTRYSYLYRSFVSNGITYYVYCYHTGITMSIEVPLIVQMVDGKQQIYMVSLPYDTTYTLNVNTKIKSLKNKAEYLEDKYHQFEYPNYLSESTDKVSDVKKWYIDYCNGYEEDGVFYFTYIGITYYVTFSDSYFSIYVK